MIYDIALHAHNSSAWNADADIQTEKITAMTEEIEQITCVRPNNGLINKEKPCTQQGMRWNRNTELQQIS